MRKQLWIAMLSVLFSQQAATESLYNSDVLKRLKDLDKDGVIAIRDKCPNSPLGSRVNNEGCSISKKFSNSVENKVELDIRFDTSKYIVKDSEVKGLLKLGNFLQKFQTTDVIIEGHTDAQGDEDKNLQLSQNRANAIKQALIDRFRISPNRIKAIGHGENNPIADNETQYGRAANRRVTAEVTHLDTKEFHSVEKRWTIYTVDSSELTNLNI
jgi:outer membrane protein OmpA-like peptidoglycan-associated protein